MNIRSLFSIYVAKSIKFILNKSGRDGSSLPGKVAMKIAPKVLKDIAKDYRVVVVTGTNGKTQTTSLLTAILKTKYKYILTNPSGANLLQGIVSCFVTSRHYAPKIAVLEVDEASLKYVTELITPEVIVFTNVFRDQMDRYGEIYSTLNEMITGVKNAANATVFVNGDMPIFHYLDLPNKIKYFGFEHEEERDLDADQNSDGILCPECQHVLRYRINTYSNLGKYYCPRCNLERHGLDYAVTNIESLTTTSSTFNIGQTRITIPVAGFYNIYNALAAYSVAHYFGIGEQAIAHAIGEAKNVFGRQERFQLNGRHVALNLIKNPVGFNQIVDLIELENESFTLAVLLNDRPADGTDVSWIWDGNFEKLAELTVDRPVYLSGLRTEELKIRFEIAEVPLSEIIIEKDYEALLEMLSKSTTEKVYILATYTALLDLRKILQLKGYIKGGMQ